MAYKNPEDLKAYRASHRAEARERSRLWRLANPGRLAAKHRARRAADPDGVRAKERLWRAANRDRINETQRRWRARSGYAPSELQKKREHKDGLKQHGLTVAGYDEMLAAQSGVCAICGSASPRMKNARRLYVDHCHTSDRIRGLLCFRCNSLLGFADDCVDTLRRALAYLERPNDCGIVRGEARSLLRDSGRRDLG